MNQISRKDFFKEVFGFFKDEIHKGENHTPANLYFYLPPPGVNAFEKYTESCNRCYECVGKCPPLALEVCRDIRSPLYGYPTIHPAREVCIQCADYPCIEACSQAALKMEFLNAIRFRAIILQNTCLNYQDHFCITCLNVCPETVKAIRLNANGHPQVDPLLCTGCGICARACPAPQEAIAFLKE